MQEMKQLTLIDGKIYLDRDEVSNVKSFNIVSSTNGSNIAELTICMDVSICSETHTDEIDKFAEYFINS